MNKNSHMEIALRTLSDRFGAPLRSLNLFIVYMVHSIVCGIYGCIINQLSRANLFTITGFVAIAADCPCIAEFEVSDVKILNTVRHQFVCYIIFS